MALVTLGLPIFGGGPDEDVERHVELFSGYIAGLGINPAQMDGANPPGEARTRGLFRASLTGEAGNWFDEEFIGKHWELQNLFCNHGQANWAGVVGQTMQQLTASNSFRNPSDAFTFANVAANNAVTLANSGLLPAYGLFQDWGPIGGCPTNRPVTPIAAGGAGVPLVLPHIRVGNMVYWFRRNYKTVQQTRREAQFGELKQDDRPVDIFYRDVVKIGKLLEYPERIIESQFFRGLNMENMLEVDRIGDRPLSEMVETLKKVEKRKAEMKLGLTRRFKQTDPLQQKYNVPELASPITSAQEPTILKPVTSHAITQDMLNKLLQQHTENLTNTFQSQIQTLQEKVAQSVQNIQPRQTVQSNEQQRLPDDYTMKIGYNSPRDNTFLERLQARLVKQIKERERRREDMELARALKDLSIDDKGDDPMDTSNMVRIGDTLFDDDGNEFTIQALRKKKLA